MVSRKPDTAVLISLACSSSSSSSPGVHAARSHLIETEGANQWRITTAYARFPPLLPQRPPRLWAWANCLRHVKQEQAWDLGYFSAPRGIFSPAAPEQQSVIAPFSRFLPPHELTPVSSCREPRNSALQQCASPRGGQPCDLRNYSTYGDASSKNSRTVSSS